MVELLQPRVVYLLEICFNLDCVLAVLYRNLELYICRVLDLFIRNYLIVVAGCQKMHGRDENPDPEPGDLF